MDDSLEVLEDVEQELVNESLVELIEVVKSTTEMSKGQQEKLDMLIDLIISEKEQASKEAEEQAILAEEEAKAKAEAEELALAEKEGQAETEAEVGELEAEYKQSLLAAIQEVQESESEVSVEMLARLDSIVAHQETIIEQQLQPSMADNVANIYGLAVIPAAIVLFTLWKMIKPWI